MENLPEGLSAETEEALRRLYQRYLDHDKEVCDLGAEIEESEARLLDAKGRSARALQEYHRILGRVQREAGKARRGLKRRVA